MPTACAGRRQARSSAAREALERAVRGWDERGRIWEATWARLDLAGCLLRMNRHADAADVIADVRAAAGDLRSEPLLARADELARAGRGRGAEDEPWRPLTIREFEVARQIAGGPDERADRRGAVRLTEDGQRARRAHPRQARGQPPRRDRRLGRDDRRARGGADRRPGLTDTETAGPSRARPVKRRAETGSSAAVVARRRGT